MVRLTQKEAGRWQVKGIPWEQLHEGAVLTKEASQILYMCLCKLKDYEDSGMDPERLENIGYELEDMAMQACNGLCRYPQEITDQAELDAACGDCPVNVFLDRIFAAEPAGCQGKKSELHRCNREGEVMGRLTAKSKDGYHYPYCFGEDTCCGEGYSSKCDKCDFAYKVCEKLGRLEDLQEQGRLLELPCAVGDTVYEIYRFMGEGAWEINVHKIRLEDLDRIGKTVFLTREEAEGALKRMAEEK